MKILFVAAECAPFAKVGGLADVIGSLPKALAKLGHEVKIVIPKYKKIDHQRYQLQLISDTKITIPWPTPALQNEAFILQGVLPHSPVEIYFIGNEHNFGRDEIYQVQGQDYPDNAERFAFFCQAALALCKYLNWRPDIIHCHDWQTGLLPAYIKIYPNEEYIWNRVKTVFTIHNLAYQGIFPPERLNGLAMPDWTYTPKYIEFYHNINLMKAGLVFADTLTTVSEQYSREIQTAEYGCGLEGVLIERKNDLFGIINGIDYEEWNPQTDPELAASFSRADLSGKQKNKRMLLKENKLPIPRKKDIPVIGLISRLTDQKGFDIIAEIAQELLQLDVQLVILGTGEPKYHALFTELHKQAPKKIAVNLKFDARLAKLIYAGSDMFLMPSKFEPCGLGQMISLAYGTIPIVRKTGGLADTIDDYNPATESGTGFVFEEYTGKALLTTIQRALAVYQNKTAWKKLIENAMRADFSWDASAKKYITLYQR
ncbi:MAG: glycogen synthase GlgA [bacterium]|nr:glycogen synthase GlgA [bacterium]